MCGRPNWALPRGSHSGYQRPRPRGGAGGILAACRRAGPHPSSGRRRAGARAGAGRDECGGGARACRSRAAPGWGSGGGGGQRRPDQPDVRAGVVLSSVPVLSVLTPPQDASGEGRLLVSVAVTLEEAPLLARAAQGTIDLVLLPRARDG